MTYILSKYIGMACCGRGKTSIIVQSSGGRAPAPKQPALKPKVASAIPKPMPLSVPVIAKKGIKIPGVCPLCGAKLMAVTKMTGGVKKTYIDRKSVV